MKILDMIFSHCNSFCDGSELNDPYFKTSVSYELDCKDVFDTKGNVSFDIFDSGDEITYTLDRNNTKKIRNLSKNDTCLYFVIKNVDGYSPDEIFQDALFYEENEELVCIDLYLAGLNKENPLFLKEDNKPINIQNFNMDYPISLKSSLILDNTEIPNRFEKMHNIFKDIIIEKYDYSIKSLFDKI